MSYKGQRLGWGPWRRDWYSFCSRHWDYAEGCTACAAGDYVWRVPHMFGHVVYKFCKPLWLWWVNRPNSRSRRRIEKHFPNLRRRNTE